MTAPTSLEKQTYLLYNFITILLVAAILTIIWVGIPVDLISLYLTFVQTLIAVMTFVDLEEKHSMTNRLLVVSGTHGVVQVCWDRKAVTSAE